MAGYHGFSKSNNAVNAESMGRYPASKLAKQLGVKPGAIKALMAPSEWHHTSSWYNSTDYYDGELLLLLAANKQPDAACWEEGEIVEANELFAKLKAWRPPTAQSQRWEGCTVEWLEWSGTRNRPKAEEHKESCCAVEWTGGAFCLVTLPSGKMFRKKVNARGFGVCDSSGKRLWFQASRRC